MKKKIIIYITTIAILIGSSTLNTVYAQVPDPPGNHGSSSDQSPGGSAPIDGGVFILLGLAATYGAKKIYDEVKES